MSATRQIILASTSPRRKQLLEQIGLSFKIVASGYEEDMSLPLPPEDLVKVLAFGKANEVATANPSAIVIGADTVIALDKKVYGKPKTKQEAMDMLMELSGRDHHVLTGYSIICKELDYEYRGASISKVSFRTITEDEASTYIDTGEPMDKAGAYAIQGQGVIFVAKIEGDYSGIVGLPLGEIWQKLESLGVA